MRCRQRCKCALGGKAGIGRLLASEGYSRALTPPRLWSRRRRRRSFIKEE